MPAASWLTEKHGNGTGTRAVNNRQVRVADARRFDANEDLSSCRTGELNLIDGVMGRLAVYGASAPNWFNTAPRMVRFVVVLLIVAF